MKSEEPDTRDAFDGPLFAVSRARIYAMCGDPNTAIIVLEHSLRTPAGITVTELKCDPAWDPLRSDPRFQKLLERK